MTTLVLTILCLIMAWGIGGMLWVDRAFRLYKERVDTPWRQALDVYDFPQCEYWHKIGSEFNLIYQVNPLFWIRNWNWQPEPWEGAQ